MVPRNTTSCILSAVGRGWLSFESRPLAPSSQAWCRVSDIAVRRRESYTFSEAERRHILTKYLGLGSDPHADIAGIIGPDGSLRIKLTALATWFMSPKEDLPLALRLLRKGISLGEENQGTVLDQHFTLNNLIKVYYRDRANDALSLDLAIGACEKQIALAPLAAEMFKREERMETLPAHRGFEQLAIIREREGDYGEVVRLSSEALQQGWSGNWERRIARCDTKKESPA